MNTSSCKWISAVAAVLWMGCTGAPPTDHEAATVSDSTAALVDTAQTIELGKEVEFAGDSLQDTTRRKSEAELRRERDLQRKAEFHRKWTGHQLDSMRTGKVTLPPTELSPEKQAYLDSIQKTWQGGKKNPPH